jgi:hypothetical protein
MRTRGGTTLVTITGINGDEKCQLKIGIRSIYRGCFFPRKELSRHLEIPLHLERGEDSKNKIL